MGDEELVLVTGASGFIASHIIQQLLEQGLKVRGTVRNLNDDDKVQPLSSLGGDSNVNLELVEADLLDADCWSKAIHGCTYVLHTASPFKLSIDKEDDVIKPAVDGTLNVLRACAGKVSRVVVTSSVAAVDTGHDAPPNGDKYTEADWGILEKATTAYEKSKILAEKAAWEYVKDLPDEKKFDLIDHAIKHDNSRMIDDLGITPRLIDSAILDTGYSLIERGYVNKSPNYKPRE